MPLLPSPKGSVSGGLYIYQCVWSLERKFFQIMYRRLSHRNPNSPNRVQDLFSSGGQLPVWKPFLAQAQNYLELGKAA